MPIEINTARGELALPLGSPPLRRASGPRKTPAAIHCVAGLFAGIGGLERGLSRAGHEAAILCENDSAAKAVLSARFSEIRLHGDVRTLKAIPRGTTLIAAGFPCQDLSQAGMTRGIGGARSGLVGEVFRLVEASRVPWVLLENVPFMLQLGRGEAMNVLASTFEELGYKWAYRVIDARTFGLPQRRRRVYFLASRVGDPREILFADEAGQDDREIDRTGAAHGFYWTEGIRGLGWAVDAIPTLKGGSSLGIPSSPAILLSDGRVVTVDIRDAERLQGFPVDWTKPAELVVKSGARWKLVGNAVSVPAAEWIGRRMAKPGAALNFPTVPLHDHRPWPTAAWNIGEGRIRVGASEWPVRRAHRSLETFLRYAPPLLSEKATAGFLRRTEQARLRFPEGFIAAVRAHLERVSERPMELAVPARPAHAHAPISPGSPAVYGRP
jgi:DNA (cytosine-5)-methyltransferase 1